MNYKKIITFGLLIFIIFTISTVAASENESDITTQSEILADEELSYATTNIELTKQNNEADLISTSSDINDEEKLQMDGLFYDGDEMEDAFGYSIDIIAKNTSTYYKSTDKISVKFVNASSNEPLSDYYVEVSLMEYYDEDCASGFDFDGYTNSEGVFKVSLKNLEPGKYYLTSHIMLNPEEESSSANININWEELYPFESSDFNAPPPLLQSKILIQFLKTNLTDAPARNS